MSECNSAETTCYKRNKYVILNREKKYENNKKELKDKEEKNMKREYGWNRYNKMFEEKKKKLKEYQKNIVRLKPLNLVINVFFGFNSVCHDLAIYC